MTNQSYIKYLLNKINSKLTIVSKILLVVYICSLFIPIPNGNTSDTNFMNTLLYVYLSIVTAFGAQFLLFILASYLCFISEYSSEKKQIKTFLTIIITPIISYVICLIFNIITPFQLLSLLPLLALIIIYSLDFIIFGESTSLFKSFNFNFNKIKRIFFKK